MSKTLERRRAKIARHQEMVRILQSDRHAMKRLYKALRWCVARGLVASYAPRPVADGVISVMVVYINRGTRMPHTMRLPIGMSYDEMKKVIIVTGKFVCA